MKKYQNHQHQKAIDGLSKTYKNTKEMILDYKRPEAIIKNK